MKPHTVSFLPPFTEAVVTVAVFALIALIGIPTFHRVYVDTGVPVQGFTRLLFRLGPLELITIACILGIGASLGRLRPEFRWLSRGSALLILILGVSIALAMIAPSLSLPPP